MRLEAWNEAATTTAGLFWLAFWAFGLGYLMSSLIQVFVSRERMRKSMGGSGAGSVGLATFFGFLSSSCSFAALATTRSLFAKGAGIVPALAFLLASTNLVIELGIVIAVFLGWQFVVGEYVGGLLLIGCTWLLVKWTVPAGLVDRARDKARRDDGSAEGKGAPDWRTLIRSREGWRRVAHRYAMEWGMVWKDVTIGFTVAGLIATFVPQSFFQTLFVGSESGDPGFLEVLAQTVIGPAAAFVTFIGSMGNVPLAAVLFANGVSFAGIIAFLFSDLVVFPVLRIQARYYGWRMALYVAGVFLLAISLSALVLHYGFAGFGLLPDRDAVRTVSDRDYFAVDSTLWLNLAFLVVSAVLGGWHLRERGLGGSAGGKWSEKLLLVLALLSLGWVVGGLAVPLVFAA